jgi:hypothetical protein
MSGGQLQLNPDGSSSLLANGQVIPGRFTVNGDTVTLSMFLSAPPLILSIRGDTLWSENGQPMLVRQGAAPAPAAPPVALLKLPSTYISAQTPMDKLQLNTDKSFLLQENGQTYHGTFVANVNILELNISETSTKTTLNRQGNSLTDSSGQTWTLLGQQPASAMTNADVLKNQTVIDMVGLGLSDEVVIEKIRSAPETNFDTGIDALKALKAAKVSDAVIMTMINPKAAAPASIATRMPAAMWIGGPPGFPGTSIIAYKRANGSFVALQQCALEGSKTKGKWGMMTGLGPTRTMAVYMGPEAPVRIEERRPVFVMKNLGRANMRVAFITQLLQKEGHREVQDSHTRAFSHEEGVPEEARLGVVIADVGDGGFVSVIPKDDLPDGEYIFKFGYMGDQCYDFGISGPK